MINLALTLKIVIISLVVILLFVAFSILDLYTQLGRYKNYWEENNQKTASEGEILYVALGDSTAQGIGASSPARGYVGLIAKDLERTKKQSVRVVNLSKSGAKVKDALETQLPAFSKLNTNQKTVVTIEIGANDMINFEAKEFEKNMDSLMAELPKQTLMTDIPYFGGSRFKNKQPNVDEANKIMYKLADKHNFKLLPLHDRIKQNSGFKTFAIDWFHPSNVAYRQNWAPLFLEHIK